jgi:uncharacterized repeat protein (TIGR02543 family)
MKSINKINLFKKSLSLILVLLVFILISCTSENKSVIIFETYGGSKIGNITYVNQEDIVLPDNPTKDGHIFFGWYLDEKFTEKFESESYVFQGETKLYAKWISNSLSMQPITESDSEYFLLNTFANQFDDIKTVKIKAKTNSELINYEIIIQIDLEHPYFIEIQINLVYEFLGTVISIPTQSSILIIDGDKTYLINDDGVVELNEYLKEQEQTGEFDINPESYASFLDELNNIKLDETIFDQLFSANGENNPINYYIDKTNLIIKGSEKVEDLLLPIDFSITINKDGFITNATCFIPIAGIDSLVDEFLFGSTTSINLSIEFEYNQEFIHKTLDDYIK